MKKQTKKGVMIGAVTILVALIVIGIVAVYPHSNSVTGYGGSGYYVTTAISFAATNTVSGIAYPIQANIYGYYSGSNSFINCTTTIYTGTEAPPQPIEGVSYYTQFAQNTGTWSFGGGGLGYTSCQTNFQNTCAYTYQTESYTYDYCYAPLQNNESSGNQAQAHGTMILYAAATNGTFTSPVIVWNSTFANLYQSPQSLFQIALNQSGSQRTTLQEFKNTVAIYQPQALQPASTIPASSTSSSTSSTTSSTTALTTATTTALAANTSSAQQTDQVQQPVSQVIQTQVSGAAGAVASSASQTLATGIPILWVFAVVIVVIIAAVILVLLKSRRG